MWFDNVCTVYVQSMHRVKKSPWSSLRAFSLCSWISSSFHNSGLAHGLESVRKADPDFILFFLFPSCCYFVWGAVLLGLWLSPIQQPTPSLQCSLNSSMCSGYSGEQNQTLAPWGLHSLREMAQNDAAAHDMVMGTLLLVPGPERCRDVGQANVQSLGGGKTNRQEYPWHVSAAERKPVCLLLVSEWEDRHGVVLNDHIGRVCPFHWRMG